MAPSPPYNELDKSKKEIRLLVLEPGSADPIQCTFRQAFLTEDDKLGYETISYIWGHRIHDGKVTVGDTVLSIPISAERELRRVRRIDEKRAIWLNAVCIDQSNTSERSSQVAMMREIYLSSSTNLVLLGDGQENDTSAAEALAIVQSLFEEAKKETNDFNTWSETVHPDGHWL